MYRAVKLLMKQYKHENKTQKQLQEDLGGINNATLIKLSDPKTNKYMVKKEMWKNVRRKINELLNTQH